MIGTLDADRVLATSIAALEFLAEHPRSNGRVGAALREAGKTYVLHMYENTNHAFANDTNAARHDPDAAALAFSRSTAFLREHLGEG